MAEGDSDLQEQVPAQEQGAVSLHCSSGSRISFMSQPFEIFHFPSSGVGHDGRRDSHLPAGADEAGGVSLHVPVEPRHRGRAGGHVVFPAPLRGG